MVILDPATARVFTESIQQLQRDIHREWHRDTYVCWAVNRPAGWQDGATVEAQEVVETGTGKLYANGAGRPQASDLVISLESPYRFRTLTTSRIKSGNLLVINDTRLFRVDIAKPEDAGDQLVDVYLTELFSTRMPEVP